MSFQFLYRVVANFDVFSLWWLVPCCVVATITAYYILQKTIYEFLINPLMNPTASEMNKKVVLITGCDTGIGNHTVTQLYKLGFTCIATCLTQDGKQKLEDSLSKIKRNNSQTNEYFVHIINITNIEHIQQLETFLAKLLNFQTHCQNYFKKNNKNNKNNIKYQFWGVINNAGIMKCGEIEIMTLNDYRQCFEVNCLGTISMTKMCLKYLKYYENCRIIFVTSAVINSPMYGYSCYTVSKSGLEAFAITLRNEMKSFNINVSTILPGSFATPLLGKTNMTNQYIKNLENLNKNILNNEYGKEYFEQSMQNLTSGEMFAKYASFQIVTDAVIDALMRYKPYFRYHVKWDAKILQFFGYYFPMWFHEMLLSLPLKPRKLPKMVSKQNID